MIIKKEKMLPYPPEKVWKALTEPDSISSWLMVTDFKAEVGQPFIFKYKDAINVTGEVLEVVSPKKLVYSWRKPNTTLDTTVTWSLHETPEGTLLKLEHDGFDDQDQVNYDDHNKGWSQCLAKLETLLSA